MSKTILPVNSSQSEVTEEDDETLHAKNLQGCIGLALIKNYEGRTRRGLVHVHYNGPQELDLDGAEKTLDEFLRRFDAQPDISVAAYNPFESTALSPSGNQMFDHVQSFLENHGYTINQIDSERRCDGEDITFKDIIVHCDKIYIIYKSRTRGANDDYHKLNPVTPVTITF